MPRISMPLPRKLLSLLSLVAPLFAVGATTGCVLYGDAEEYKTCAEVVCGNHASCGGDGECFCDAGYAGNPYDGCVANQPEVDESCAADCGQNAYCSEGACYCELDHVAVCGANAGCLPQERLCDDKPDCPNSADENVAVCEEPVFQEWLITDDCNDEAAIEWRLFSMDRDWAWPGVDTSFVTSGLGALDYQTVQCFRGETICFGGASEETSWGLGIDGLGECETCCYLCGSDSLFDLGLQTCQ